MEVERSLAQHSNSTTTRTLKSLTFNQTQDQSEVTQKSRLLVLVSTKRVLVTRLPDLLSSR
jgi:hypothetical protein